MTECSPSSASVLHKQWIKLENEHHKLALQIDAAQAKKANVALMRKRQESLLLEISPLVAEIRNAPATTIEDCLALLDVALEHELDLSRRANSWLHWTGQGRRHVRHDDG